MAFRRKDIKKQYYYVWFLGAKESKGLRGEQYILPVLRQLVNIERRTEPCKVTIQISSKGIKIIQNVPKKLPNGQQPHLIENNHPPIKQPINQSNGQINNTSSTNSSNKTQHNSTKMEQIKHFIPHHAVTCALQSEDVVCIILLLYNPLTGCPVHVHGYRCDSIETAFTLRNQLQLLIERPENQKKFAEIESRLASKGLISQQQLLNNVNQNIIKQQIIKTNQITNAGNDYTSSSQQKQQILNKNKSIHQTTQLIYTATHHDSANRSKHNNTLTSDGRSAEDECNQSDGYSPTIRSEPDGQTSLNKSLVESKSSSGNSSGSSPSPQAPNPVVIEMYENLAQELKTKLNNPSEFGPLLLPPRDYDTVCRSQGKLVELDKRACTNKLLVGKTAKKNDKETKKPDNLILDTKEIKKKELEVKNDKRKIEDKKTVEVDLVKVNEKKVADSKNDQLNKMEIVEMNKIKKMNKEELNEQEKRLNHQQIREQQKQYEQKLKNLQRKQELYEQHQLLIEQQKQVRRELSQQHKPSKFIEGLANGKINKTNSKDQQIKNTITEEIKLSSPIVSKSNNCIINETSAVINTGGIKQIGSNLANKIKQSLIGSNNKDKLQPQLICHKTIHDSLQSLNKLTTTQLSNDDKFLMNKNLKLSTKNLQSTNEQNNKEQQLNKSKTKNLNNSNCKTKLSNSSSNISNVLNAEKLNTINSRSDSSNVSKSISSGIGSGANLHTNHKNNNNNSSNYDQLQYLNSSTDEELDDEILIDEYMPNDYVYNQYLNNNINNDEEDDEIVDDLDEDEEISNRVVRRMEMREKLLLLEKNKKNKLECNSTGERVQMTSSEEDDGVNYAITYDENLLPKINTVKKQSTKPIKTDKKLTNNSKNSSKESKNSISNHSIKSNSNQNLKSSINQVKRSETYYEMNSDQKKMFHHSNNNFYFPSSLTNKSPTILQQQQHQQPKLFYFPNPDFKAAQQQKQHLIKQPQLYHLGQQQAQQILNSKQCEIRRQKSTGNINGKLNYHPILMNNASGSVEKLMNNEFYHHRKSINLDNNIVPPNSIVYQRRPISMVNIQPDSNFRVHHQDKLVDPMFHKRVPIYY